MASFNSKKTGEFYAGQLLRRLKINSLPVCPRDIAGQLGIQILEQDVGDRFGGLLMNVEGSKAIFLNSAISYDARKRFTLAHELGHAEIPHHTNPEYKCLKDDIEYLSGADDKEREANAFAAELLMPTDLVADAVQLDDVSFHTIKLIADKCQTSLISSALKYVQLSPELCAVVVAENSSVKFSSLSKCLFNKGVRLSAKTPLHKRSIAHDFFCGKLSCKTEEKDEVDIKAWFPEFDCTDYKCYEDAVNLGSCGQTISLISLMPNKNYDDGDSEDEY